MARPGMRAVVADDDASARRHLLGLLAAMGGAVAVVGECASGRDAVRQVREQQPDLLLLDVHMPDMSGFDVVRELQDETLPALIFCTAWQRYAVDAFDLHAVDYLIKPVTRERLRRALQRVAQRIGAGLSPAARRAPVIGAIEDIARRVTDRTPPPAGRDTMAPEAAASGNRIAASRIAVKGADGLVLVEPRAIDWVDAAGDYMCLHVDGQTHILRSTLKCLMGRLEDTPLVRIHRSAVVNVERIAKVMPRPKGEYLLELDNGKQLKVSRNYRAAIKNLLAG